MSSGSHCFGVSQCVTFELFELYGIETHDLREQDGHTGYQKMPILCGPYHKIHNKGLINFYPDCQDSWVPGLSQLILQSH